MSKTSSQLALKALERLSVLGGGQDAPPEDFATAKDAIAPMLAELAARDVIYVADPEDIDDAYFYALADRLAIEIAPSFERAAPVSLEDAEARLRRLVASGPTYSVAKGLYF